MKLLEGLMDNIESNKRLGGIARKVKQYGVLSTGSYLISLKSVKEQIPELFWFREDGLKRLIRKLGPFAIIDGRGGWIFQLSSGEKKKD